ncbi:iron chelate uptake ABC transporter family permease subunit [Thermoactinomyces sp. Gus2-1]
MLPLSGLLGAVFVMVADMIGRTVMAPAEIPAGVFTAVIGAPYFIYLLIRQHQ